MKNINKPNFFKRLLNDKTKMSFIIMAISIFIVGGVFVSLFYIKGGDYLNFKDNETLKIVLTSIMATYSFISVLFAIMRNGTKTREKKTLEALEAIKVLHTKLTIINKQVKKLKKGKDNG